MAALESIRIGYTILMTVSSVSKLMDHEKSNDWTKNLNYCKWFQYAVGIVEVFMAICSGYNAFYKRNDIINAISIFLGFVLVGGSYYTFLLRARIKPFLRRLVMCVIPTCLWGVLYAWIIFDNLTIPVFIWTGVIIGFLGGLIIPPGDDLKSE